MFRRFLNVLILMTIVYAQNTDFDSYLKELSARFDVPQVTADSLHLENTIILDTRERAEYDISHLAKARWVGYDDFDLSRVDSIDRKAKVVVYCSVGYRSSEIAEKLIKAGFTDVSNLYGGIFNWANMKFPLMQNGHETFVIHSYDRVWRRFLDAKHLIIVP